jgi:hypothetical protein
MATCNRHSTPDAILRRQLHFDHCGSQAHTHTHIYVYDEGFIQNLPHSPQGPLGAARRLASVTASTVNQHCSCNQTPVAALNRRAHLCTLNAIRDFLRDDWKQQQSCVQFSCKSIARHEMLPAAVSDFSYWHTCTRGATSAEDCQRSGTAENVKKLSYSVNKGRRSSNSEIAGQLVGVCWCVCGWVCWCVCGCAGVCWCAGVCVFRGSQQKSVVP